ncbi:hypothetical protein DFH07DRAFT_783643 [Mycena maculata]|uniref:DNA 3'-5' helicase n=1 Tax=Mycena maculata TaxID=230809 RepID=A0AAD7HM65_9AGAR|nr:hypothetical protein DFH07DRAFT_783643 [Mycena maculata]
MSSVQQFPKQLPCAGNPCEVVSRPWIQNHLERINKLTRHLEKHKKGRGKTMSVKCTVTKPAPAAHRSGEASLYSPYPSPLTGAETGAASPTERFHSPSMPVTQTLGHSEVMDVDLYNPADTSAPSSIERPPSPSMSVALADSEAMDIDFCNPGDTGAPSPIESPPSPLMHVEAMDIDNAIPEADSAIHENNSTNGDSSFPTSDAALTLDPRLNSLLEKLGIIVKDIEGSQFLFCPECQTCISLTNAFDHAKSTHACDNPSPPERKELEHLLQSPVMTRNKEEYPFPWGKAPIDGLKPVSGFVCRPCKYACPTSKSMANHWARPDHIQTVGNGPPVSEERASIQSLFRVPPLVRWFLVEPAAQGLAPDSAFQWYLSHHAERISQPMETIPPPISPNEIPQVNRITGWRLTVSDVRNLRGLLSLPRTQDGTGVARLADIVLPYLKRAGKIAADTSVKARQELMEFPRGQTTWHPRVKETTLTQYAALLRRFVTAIIRSTEPECSTTYRFPLSPSDKDTVDRYVKSLNTRLREEEEVQAFHVFISFFLLARPSDNPVVGNSKFDHALQCLLALESLKADGNLEPPSTVGPVLSKTLYIIRCAIVFHAYLLFESRGSGLDGAISEVAALNLAPNTDSPYNHVNDLQKLVTGLARSAVRPGVTRVTTDGLNITHGEDTLNVPKYRAGLDAALQASSLSLQKLLCGHPAVLAPRPENCKDDWSNRMRGYNIASTHRYVKENSFLAHLVDTQQDLTREDSVTGDLHISEPALDRLIADDAQLLNVLMPLVFCTIPMASVPNFVEARIQNTDRLRSLFAYGETLWLITERRTWDTAVHCEEYIPHLIPLKVAELLLLYLMIVRPALVELLRVVRRDLVSQRYADFLWVRDGRCIDSKTFATMLQKFTGDFCCTALTPEPYRLIQIEMFRIFLNSSAEWDHEEDDLLATSRGHRLSTASQIYAKEEGHLPMLPSDILVGYQSRGNDWAQVIGLRPGFPPLQPILNRHLVAQQCQEQMVTTVTCAPLPANDSLFDLFTAVQAVKGRVENRLQVMADLIFDVIEKTGANVGADHRKYISEGLMDVWSQRQGVFTTPRLASVAAPPGNPMAGAMQLFPQAETTLGDITPSLIQNGDTEMPTQKVGHPEFGLSLLTRSQTALSILREFYKNENADFLSDEQREAVTMALRGSESFAAFLPTGAGKSLIFHLPAYHEQVKWTMVVCPYVALLRDQMLKATNLKLVCVQWSTAEQDVPESAQIIFLALESAATSQSYINQTRFITSHIDRVSRIIFDECHGIFCEDYRPHWRKLHILATLPTQIIWLSASVPVSLQKQLFREFDRPGDTRTIRAPLWHPHIAIHRVVIRPHCKNLERFLFDLIRHLEGAEMKTGEQGVLFFHSKQAIKSFEKYATDRGLQVATSYNDTDHDRDHQEALWFKHECRWILATGTLIAGVDNAQCAVAAFVNFDPGLLLLTQGLGRVRTKRGLGILVCGERTPQNPTKIMEPDTGCFMQSAEVFNNIHNCHRLVFGRTFNQRASSCHEIIDAQVCGVCDPDGSVARAIKYLYPDPADDEEDYPSMDGWTDELMSQCDLSGASTSSSSNKPDAQPLASTLSSSNKPDAQPLAFTPSMCSNGPTTQAPATQPIHESQGPKVMGDLLMGKCSGCWASSGMIRDIHPNSVMTCTGVHPQASLDALKTFRTKIRLPRFNCWRCGLPNRDDTHPFHARRGFSEMDWTTMPKQEVLQRIRASALGVSVQRQTIEHVLYLTFNYESKKKHLPASACRGAGPPGTRHKDACETGGGRGGVSSRDADTLIIQCWMRQERFADTMWRTKPIVGGHVPVEAVAIEVASSEDSPNLS